MSHVTLTLVACEKWFKKTALRIFWSWFKNLFTSTLDTTIISKMSNTHWHPGKRCCIPLHEKNLSKFWLKILFVTSHNESEDIQEMEKAASKNVDHRQRNGSYLFLPVTWHDGQASFFLRKFALPWRYNKLSGTSYSTLSYPASL